MNRLVHDNRVTAKQCCACEQTKPISQFYYRPTIKRWDSRCDDCRKAYLREYAAKHRDKILAQTRAARQRKLEHYRRKNREWNWRNPEKVRVYKQTYARAYYAAHKEELRAKARARYQARKLGDSKWQAQRAELVRALTGDGRVAA